ncbi:hypothetical protein GUJ93_ZPchr0002g24724 [Zizania palustris]|uniref:Uncharacterized protein n=1 Tax=Zizania palustris TaxID=103762 RepID=A0A8J5RZ63_ZIZPA|nr:hypothetical protein GUJ93_ZPchr0002g24724 [Zizania palustris]
MRLVFGCKAVAGASRGLTGRTAVVSSLSSSHHFRDPNYEILTMHPGAYTHVNTSAYPSTDVPSNMRRQLVLFCGQESVHSVAAESRRLLNM